MSTKPIYKKVPKTILILSDDILYYPNVISEIDYTAKDTVYDLVICVGKCLRMSVEYPFSIANSEIWFEYGAALTKAIFDRAMHHYSNCEIKNGK